jgi:hypothetical protein
MQRILVVEDELAIALLRARIKAVLRRGVAARAELLRFGDVEVDLEACTVRRRGKPVDLTPIEFKLSCSRCWYGRAATCSRGSSSSTRSRDRASR